MHSVLRTHCSASSKALVVPNGYLEAAQPSFGEKTIKFLSLPGKTQWTVLNPHSDVMLQPAENETILACLSTSADILFKGLT